jgi:hypothetical protein
MGKKTLFRQEADNVKESKYIYISSQQAFLDLFQFCKVKFINPEENTTD